MTESKPLPSRLLKLFATAATWCLGVVLLAWLALALAWGALHGWIVPRIGEFRPQLESEASRLLGMPVRIGAISAQSVHLIPQFELRDVAVLDPQGREALKLPRVVAALSPASLLKLGFEQLIIDQPELDIRRSADGKIFVAGLDFSQTTHSDGRAQDWLFSQTELVVRGGTVRWTDEQRGAPPLALNGVDFVMRNRGLRHGMRLDASPPAEWGDRFSLNAQFRQPLLSTHRGRWQDWDGPVYASLPRVDVLQLRQYADLGFDLAQGVGALRVWADVNHGQVLGGTADVALQNASMTLGAGLQPLALQSLQGRIGARQLAGGFEFSTEGLQFTTDEGLQWPGGNVFFSRQDGEGRIQGQGSFKADRLDLATLAQIANRLPLDQATHAALATYAPKGLVEQVEASWHGAMAAPAQYQAKGRVSGLELAAGVPAVAVSAAGHPVLGRPGVRGATVEFTLTQGGGKASVQIDRGALDLPGVFEEPVVPMAQLSGAVAWQLGDGKVAVQANDVRFANADAEGTLQASWHTSDVARGAGRSRFPGVLDLQGQLTRADGTRVHRYLPLELHAEVRHYVRDAVLAGSANRVKFKVKGDLHDFPFATAKQGDFHIAADVQNATYVYVPPSLQPANTLPWPALEQLSGELVFDHSSLQVNRASGKLSGAPGFQMTQADAQIADLAHGVVLVNAQGRGPLTDMLGVVARSPLAAEMDNALEHATASGAADLRLRLQLPLANIEKSKAQGSLTLAGNDLQMGPSTLGLAKARGVINFSETGFNVVGGQAKLLGGDVKIEGGTRASFGANNVGGTVDPHAGVQFRLQGVATAEGLRQTPGLGALSRLAQFASGSTSYTAMIGSRRGVPEISARSSLQGLALNLPAPLNKAAETSMPMRFDNTLVSAAAAPLRDQLTVDLARVGSVSYIRDVSGPEAKVLRGMIAVGLAPGESAPMPEEGVAAKINLGAVSVDAWDAVVSKLNAPAVAAAPAAASAVNADAYAPTTLTVRASALTAGGRTLHQLVLAGSHSANAWRGNIDATELSGYVEYRQPVAANAGLVYARLARLTLAPSSETEVDSLLDAPSESVPALDIVVDDLELKGKKLGRVEIEALNRAGRNNGSGGSGGSDAGVREWRLSKLKMTTPEAQFSASGNWVALGSQAVPLVAGRAAPRRTVLNFNLDINDAGQLLTRMGMPDVIRRGKGQMDGQIAWIGSPLSLDYPTLGGQFNLSIDNGQFLKADPGLAKLLGVLNLQALPRRLTLDFRDVFSEGFAFDFIRGDVHIDQGTATTNNLQMKGVNAAVLMEGSASIPREVQDLKVVVVPEINAGTASLVAAVINPAVGLGTFLAQWLLRRPLSEAATQEFHIDGTWADPKITKIPRKSLLGQEPKAEAALPSKNGATP
ncbi:YhdP family protein [Rhodoferax sp.]|uniref:YhdP family protein n=1 Tax=Rhodoferax sp. TaxID=50421 RepID=UPI00374D228A